MRHDFGFLFVLCLMVLGLAAPPAFSETVSLNISSLKQAIAERTVASWGQTDALYQNFSADQVVIAKEIPVFVNGVPFFAVKAILKSPNEKPDELLFLIVDRSGRFQFPDILDIRTGTSLFSDAMTELRKIEDLSDDFGSLIFEGKGKHGIVLVSDPFCTFCRRGWSYLVKEKAKIKALKLAHLPLNKYSELVCMALLDAEKRGDNLFEMVNFAYGDLKQTADDEVIVRHFLKTFPHLRKIWGETPKEAVFYLRSHYTDEIQKEVQRIRGMGMNSTPVFFIDKHMIEGFQEKPIRERMQ